MTDKPVHYDWAGLASRAGWTAFAGFVSVVGTPEVAKAVDDGARSHIPLVLKLGIPLGATLVSALKSLVAMHVGDKGTVKFKRSKAKVPEATNPASEPSPVPVVVASPAAPPAPEPGSPPAPEPDWVPAPAFDFPPDDPDLSDDPDEDPMTHLPSEPGTLPAWLIPELNL